MGEGLLDLRQVGFRRRNPAGEEDAVRKVPGGLPSTPTVDEPLRGGAPLGARERLRFRRRNSPGESYAVTGTLLLWIDQQPGTVALARGGRRTTRSAARSGSPRPVLRRDRPAAPKRWRGEVANGLACPSIGRRDGSHRADQSFVDETSARAQLATKVRTALCKVQRDRPKYGEDAHQIAGRGAPAVSYPVREQLVSSTKLTAVSAMDAGQADVSDARVRPTKVPLTCRSIMR